MLLLVVIFGILLLFILIVFFIVKINPSKDIVYNIKNIFHPKIVFQLKKVYLKYLHDFKSFSKALWEAYT